MTILTFKALHLIFMVTWYAAMFYLPRLFVYHSSTEDPIARKMFCVMEKKLYSIIMTPSAVLTLVFGLILFGLTWSSHATSLWIYIKLVIVLLLFAFHGICGSIVRKFANDTNTKSEKFFRIFNEIPALTLVAIIFLAVFKPF